MTNDEPRPTSSLREPSPVATLHVETATQKVRLAEDAWNTRDPARVALAYTGQPMAQPRRVPAGPRGDRGVPQRKWNRELDYRLIKELWAFRRQPHRRALRL